MLDAAKMDDAYTSQQLILPSAKPSTQFNNSKGSSISQKWKQQINNNEAEDGLCYFHKRFGNDARKCRTDCAYHGVQREHSSMVTEFGSSSSEIQYINQPSSMNMGINSYGVYSMGRWISGLANFTIALILVVTVTAIKWPTFQPSEPPPLPPPPPPDPTPPEPPPPPEPKSTEPPPPDPTTPTPTRPPTISPKPTTAQPTTPQPTMPEPQTTSPKPTITQTPPTTITS
ncbi:histone acetyltransferase KAT6A-like [Drosophila innubila]|uniref:histone acetyltransferase KAT6A-like n=1 Tax=Drosophila innubila TaxID=198719 RepID=UPI00148BE79F|nr:histone acetyltransferase KAT6A-like [Drosophila innubila]